MYRGQLFLKMNKDNEAIKDFQTYLSKTMDKTGDIWNSLGCCYQNLKDYKSSIESFSKAIQISQNGLFYYNRAISFYNLHKFDAACEDASMSISLGYNVSSAFFKAAHCK